MSVRDFFEKVTGLDHIKEHTIKLQEQTAQFQEELVKQRLVLEQEKTEFEKEKAIHKKTPKEIATEKNEPWVSVLETKVDKDNPKNGFFELDWNKQFIDYLILHGYGFESDPEEEIVDRWFRDLALNIMTETGYHSDIGAGFIDVNKFTK